MKWLAIVVVVGCSDGHTKPDAAIDAAHDGKMPDAGKCGAGVPFEAEHIDWDSTDAAFCGVFQATWKVHGSSDPLQTYKIGGPNGRVEMCIPSQPSVMIDITVPTTASECLPSPGTYAIAGLAVTNTSVEAMLSTTNVFRARSFTATRETTFYQAIGVAYDAGKGGLMIHNGGSQHSVSIDAAHAATQRFDGTTWAAGDTGIDVFFPNVTPGTATITAAAGTVGIGGMPIQANTITYVTIVSP